MLPSHYFIGIKGPEDMEPLMNSYIEKYQLIKNYKVIPHPVDLHVTLVFIGALSDESLPLLKENLHAIAENTPSFNMDIDGLSYFGSPSGPRVIYFSIEAPNALEILQKKVDQTVADQLGRSITDRFTPHMTIAKKRKNTDTLNMQKEKWKPIVMPVQSFSLFAIHPDKTPKYEAIETFELR